MTTNQTSSDQEVESLGLTKPDQNDESTAKNDDSGLSESESFQNNIPKS